MDVLKRFRIGHGRTPKAAATHSSTPFREGPHQRGYEQSGKQEAHQFYTEYQNGIPVAPVMGPDFGEPLYGGPMQSSFSSQPQGTGKTASSPPPSALQEPLTPIFGETKGSLSPSWTGVRPAAGADDQKADVDLPEAFSHSSLPRDPQAGTSQQPQGSPLRPNYSKNESPSISGSAASWHDEDWDNAMLWAGAVMFCGWVNKLSARSGRLPKKRPRAPTSRPNGGSAVASPKLGSGGNHGRQPDDADGGHHKAAPRHSAVAGDPFFQNLEDAFAADGPFHVPQPAMPPPPATSSSTARVRKPRSSTAALEEAHAKLATIQLEELLYKSVPILYRQWKHDQEVASQFDLAGPSPAPPQAKQDPGGPFFDEFQTERLADPAPPSGSRPAKPASGAKIADQATTKSVAGNTQTNVDEKKAKDAVPDAPGKADADVTTNADVAIPPVARAGRPSPAVEEKFRKEAMYPTTRPSAPGPRTGAKQQEGMGQQQVSRPSPQVEEKYKRETPYSAGPARDPGPRHQDQASSIPPPSVVEPSFIPLSSRAAPAAGTWASQAAPDAPSSVARASQGGPDSAAWTTTPGLGSTTRTSMEGQTRPSPGAPGPPPFDNPHGVDGFTADGFEELLRGFSAAPPGPGWTGPGGMASDGSGSGAAGGSQAPADHSSAGGGVRPVSQGQPQAQPDSQQPPTSNSKRPEVASRRRPSSRGPSDVDGIPEDLLQSFGTSVEEQAELLHKFMDRSATESGPKSAPPSFRGQHAHTASEVDGMEELLKAFSTTPAPAAAPKPPPASQPPPHSQPPPVPPPQPQPRRPSQPSEPPIANGRPPSPFDTAAAFNDLGSSQPAMGPTGGPGRGSSAGPRHGGPGPFEPSRGPQQPPSPPTEQQQRQQQQPQPPPSQAPGGVPARPSTPPGFEDFLRAFGSTAPPPQPPHHDRPHRASSDTPGAAPSGGPPPSGYSRPSPSFQQGGPSPTPPQPRPPPQQPDVEELLRSFGAASQHVPRAGPSPQPQPDWGGGFSNPFGASTPFQAPKPAAGPGPGGPFGPAPHGMGSTQEGGQWSASEHMAEDALETEIRRWAQGKEGNLRSLLETLQLVLWPECKWRPVTIADLVTGAAVKKAYQRAILCVHPDKVHGDTQNHKVIAKLVFNYLKEAYNKFSSEELF